MKLPLALWLLLALTVCGAHTMAWKVPMETLIWDGVTNPECQRLKNPPSASAFFRPGDELWDVVDTIEWFPGNPSEIDPFAPDQDVVCRHFEGEWLVWNATSERLVGRGSWAQLHDLDRSIVSQNQPRLIRTTLEIDDPRRGPRRISMITRSGERGSLRTPGLELDCEMVADGESRYVDLSGTAFWVRGEEWRDGMDLELTLATGRTKPVARWNDTDGSWEVRLTAVITTLDGTPATRIRQLETPGGLQWIDEQRLDERRLSNLAPPRDDGLAVRSFNVAPDFAGRLGGERDNELPDLERPKNSEVFPGDRWINVSPAFREYGIRLEDPSIAGFHPGRCLLTVVGTLEEVDLVQQIVTPGPTPPPSQVELSFASPRWKGMLLCRSGEKVSIFRSRNHKSRELLIVAPNIGANDTLIDAGFTIDLDGEIQLESAATLVTGDTVEIFSSEADGTSETTTLTGTVRTVDP